MAKQDGVGNGWEGIGLYNTELVRNRGPWRGPDDLELACLEGVNWFNHRRLFHESGRVPPAEFEEKYYIQTESDHQVETQTIRAFPRTG